MDEPISQPDSRPVESIFDDELCELIEKFSNDGMMTAGQIVSVMEFVKHGLIHQANNIAEEGGMD